MKKLPLDSIYEDFLASLATDATRHTYRLPIRRFQNFLKSENIKSPWLSQEIHLLQFFRGLRGKYKDSVCATNRNALRALFQWGLDTKQVTWNPANRLSRERLHLYYNPCPMPPEARRRFVLRIIRPATFEECRYSMAFALGLYQGFRIHEACKVKVADFNFESKTIYVMGKGKKPKTLRLDPVVENLAKTLLRHHHNLGGHPELCPTTYLLAQRRDHRWGNPGLIDKPAHMRSIQRQFKKMALECKTGPAVRFHHLRHTYLTSIREHGGDLFDVMDLGRCTAETAQHYVANSDSRRNRISDSISSEILPLLRKTVTP